jgi:HAMP domain-containing protein
MKTFRWLLIGLGVILHVTAILLLQSQSREHHRETATARAKRELTRAVQGADEFTFSRQVTKALWKELERGNDFTGSGLERASKTLARRFSLPGLEVALLDAAGEPRAAFPALSEGLSSNRHLMVVPQVTGWQFRTQIWRQRRSEEFPYLVSTWFIPPKPAGPVHGLLVGLNLARLPLARMVQRQILGLRRRGFDAGWFDQISRREFPARNPPLIDDRLVNRYFNAAGEMLETANGPVFLLPFRGGKVFWCRVSPPPERVPWASFILLGLWLVGALNAMRSSPPASLAGFLFTGILLATGVPLLLIACFGVSFAGNRLAATENARFTEMEQTLIDIDASFPRSLRRIQRHIEELSALLRQGSIDEFRRRLGKLQIAGELEHLWLVKPDGTHLWDITLLPVNLRLLLRDPPGERHRKVAGYVSRGNLFEQTVLDSILRFPAAADALDDRLVSRDPQEKKDKIMSGMGLLGRAMIERFRQEGGLTAREADAPSALAVNALADTEMNTMLRQSFASRGKILRFTAGSTDITYLWGDILQPANGTAPLCLLSSTEQRFGEFLLLDDFFRQFPASFRGWRFVAESSYAATLFPDGLRRNPFAHFSRELVPPRRLLSTVAHHGGRRFLVTVFCGEGLTNYVLMAIRPWGVVKREEFRLLRQFLSLSLTFTLFLGGLFFGLHRAMVRPAHHLAEGARAIEQGRFETRLDPGTRDEWADLAKAFNETLAHLGEMEVASQVQKCLLPDKPRFTPFAEFRGENLMTSQVGGDYFDSFVLPDGSLLGIVGDVTGHGLPAALAVSMVKSSCQILVDIGVADPGDLLRRLEPIFLQLLQRKLAMTCQVFRLFPDGRLVIANAGHPYPLLLLADGRNQELLMAGPPLGIKTRMPFGAAELVMAPGDRLLIYSDGLIEQMNEAETPFFSEFLDWRTAGEFPAGTAPLIAELLRRLNAFAGRETRDDDVTICVLAYTAAPRQSTRS